MKAFALLEFLVFLAVLSIVIVAMASSISFKQPKRNAPLNITLCSTLGTHCILDSKIPQTHYYFEVK